MNNAPPPPPLPGDWSGDFHANNGNWSLGPLWLDRPSHRLAMLIETQHCNAFSSMHGGAMATFADMQCLAVRDYSSGEINHTPTISLSLDYLAPAPAGAWLIAEISLLRQTRSLLFTQALMLVDGVPVARSNAIYRFFS